MESISVTCPHCGAVNSSAGAFCESCGKALPRAASSGPRILSGDALPTSAAGHKLVGEELKKLTNRASRTLLVVGIIQWVVGGILYAVVSNTRGSAANLGVDPKFLMAIQFGVGAIFVALFFWARFSPLPASIVGLVIYSTLVLLNIVNAVSQMGESGTPRGNGIGGLGVGWLDILIIAILARGITAALKSRQLLRQQPTF